MLSVSQFSCSVMSDALWPHESQHGKFHGPILQMRKTRLREVKWVSQGHAAHQRAWGVNLRLSDAKPPLSLEVWGWGCHCLSLRGGNKASLGNVSKWQSTSQKLALCHSLPLLVPPALPAQSLAFSPQLPSPPSLPLYPSLHLSPLISNFQACELLQKA